MPRAGRPECAGVRDGGRRVWGAVLSRARLRARRPLGHRELIQKVPQGVDNRWDLRGPEAQQGEGDPLSLRLCDTRHLLGASRGGPPQVAVRAAAHPALPSSGLSEGAARRHVWSQWPSPSGANVSRWPRDTVPSLVPSHVCDGKRVIDKSICRPRLRSNDFRQDLTEQKLQPPC